MTEIVTDSAQNILGKQGSQVDSSNEIKAATVRELLDTYEELRKVVPELTKRNQTIKNDIEELEKYIEQLDNVYEMRQNAQAHIEDTMRSGLHRRLATRKAICPQIGRRALEHASHQEQKSFFRKSKQFRDRVQSLAEQDRNLILRRICTTMYELWGHFCLFVANWIPSFDPRPSAWRQMVLNYCSNEKDQSILDDDKLVSAVVTSAARRGRRESHELAARDIKFSYTSKVTSTTSTPTPVSSESQSSSGHLYATNESAIRSDVSSTPSKTVSLHGIESYNGSDVLRNHNSQNQYEIQALNRNHKNLSRDSFKDVSNKDKHSVQPTSNRYTDANMAYNPSVKYRGTKQTEKSSEVDSETSHTSMTLPSLPSNVEYVQSSADQSHNHSSNNRHVQTKGEVAQVDTDPRRYQTLHQHPSPPPRPY